MDENLSKRTSAYGDIGKGMQDWHKEDFDVTQEGEMGSFYTSAQSAYDTWLDQLRQGWG